MTGTLPFTLVTGNADKLAEAERIVGARIDSVSVDLPEIQSLDVREVLAGKAAEAFARVGRPVVVEETALELDCLGGFPGPFVKWMLASAGPEGIARCAIGMGDPRATARCLLLYFDGQRRIEGEGIDPGMLVFPTRGEAGFGWDPVFQPEGSTLTYAELGEAEKDARAHRGLAWRDLLAKLDATASAS